jgi:hypothetical protein
MTGAPDRWGTLHLSNSDPATGRAWTDTGARTPRQLRHRARDDVRPVPCPPQLTAILRRHLTTFGTAPDGRLFYGRRGGTLSDSVYGRTWLKTRQQGAEPRRGRLATRGTPV